MAENQKNRFEYKRYLESFVEHSIEILDDIEPHLIEIENRYDQDAYKILSEGLCEIATEAEKIKLDIINILSQKMADFIKHSEEHKAILSKDSYGVLLNAFDTIRRVLQKAHEIKIDDEIINLFIEEMNRISTQPSRPSISTWELLGSRDTENNLSICIQSEKDAWECLKALSDETPVEDKVNIEFNGWPFVEIIIKKPVGARTLPISVMSGLTAFQDSLYRIAAIIKCGSPTIDALTNEEILALRLNVKIDDGSLIITIQELRKSLEVIANKFCENMSGKQKVILAVTLAVILCSTWTSGKYIEMVKEKTKIEMEYKERTERYRYLEKKIETLEETLIQENKNQEDHFLTQEEFEDLFKRSINEEPKLKLITEESDVAKRNLFSSLKGDGEIEINGITYTPKAVDALGDKFN